MLLLELANESRIGNGLPTKKICMSLYSLNLGLIRIEDPDELLQSFEAVLSKAPTLPNPMQTAQLIGSLLHNNFQIYIQPRNHPAYKKLWDGFPSNYPAYNKLGGSKGDLLRASIIIDCKQTEC